MKMIRKIPTFILLMLLVACGSELPQPVETGTSSTMQVDNLHDTPTVTFQPSATPTTMRSSRRPTETGTHTPLEAQTPTVTMHPLPTNQIIEEIINIENQQSENNLAGRIVLEGQKKPCCDIDNIPYQSPSYILDLDSEETWEVPLDPVEIIKGFAISPDRKFIAYLVESPYNQRIHLKILNFMGLLQNDMDLENLKLWNLVDWYDGKHVIFTGLSPRKNDYTDVPWPLIVYNPFAQETLKILDTLELPGAKGNPVGYQWDKLAFCLCAYSPNEQFVVYQKNEPYLTSLWNMEKQQEIVKFNTGSPYSGPPRWSNDGSFFVIDGFVDPLLYAAIEVKFAEELYRINLEGEVERLTFLTETYESIEITSPSLSPDNNKIAFNLSTDPERREYHVAVLDLVSQEIVVFRSLEPYRFTDYLEYMAPVWSPASDQILLTHRQEDDHFSTLILDLNNGLAVEIAREMVPVGWIFDDTQ